MPNVNFSPDDGVVGWKSFGSVGHKWGKGRGKRRHINTIKEQELPNHHLEPNLIPTDAHNFSKPLQLLLASAALLVTAMAQTKLRIMPLGDSITEVTCWRTLLWDDLTAAGVTGKIEFVGSMTDNIADCIGKTPTWDHTHEGHSGYLAIDIANDDLVDWLISARPDIVMFMLGTNDVLRGHTTSEITEAYTEMVQEMRASNPRMKIIVSIHHSNEGLASLISSQIDLVIPLPFLDADIAALNAAIPAWAQSQNSTASPIYVADCNAGFPSTALRDGVHPNTAGDHIIASRLYPILLQVINQSNQSNQSNQQSNQSLTGTTKVTPIAHRDW